MPKPIAIDPVRASRAGHNFHEQWAARRSLQLIFPRDRLHAIAVEGISTTDPTDPGAEAEDIADLTLYYGHGDTFKSSERVETIQFKYRVGETPVSASYLKKTLQKFCTTILGYEDAFSEQAVDQKLSFAFVTNAKFSEALWQAIASLKDGSIPTQAAALGQFQNLNSWCCNSGVDARRLFAMTDFQAAQKSLPAQKRQLRRLLTDWSGGADSQARVRLHALVELVVEKAGLAGQKNNLIKREDVLDALGCDEEQLFPADMRFVDVGAVIERSQLQAIIERVRASVLPVLIHGDGGVGKTVLVQSLAANISDAFEVVVFDCFGGGAYRSDQHPRHLPAIGLIQIANELAARGLCDPLLPGDNDSRGLIKAVRKRVQQASDVVRQQSEKAGVLLIVDAADNAQVEADLRKEDAFPKLLLSSLSENPIDGVKLLLTARPHRLSRVVGRSAVIECPLEPFSDAEARAFIDARRPGAPELQLARALARSGRNARALAYLIDTWEQNVAGNASETPITVEQIIAQRCQKIVGDLHTLGWSDNETREFFAALALLPPPIPLAELAIALGWPPSQVNSAASDLAPMLEIVPQGAIFRDEPTETYVHDTYSNDSVAQQSIAQRLANSQATSSYAAEALPGFLVAINDSDRAYALANDAQFPRSIGSDYGRRRLTLARRQAAFRLAVKDGDHDRALKLMMLLAQVVAANTRGDQFIRRSPGLGVKLGDKDVSRRLFNDRSGWRGARDARLTLAYSFTGDIEEANIHRGRAVGWLNWHYQNPPSDQFSNDPRPDLFDFTAVLFLSALEKNFTIVDRNLSAWGLRFSLSVGDELISLAAQHERLTGSDVLAALARFAGTKACKSFALKVALLARPTSIPPDRAKAIAANLHGVPRSREDNKPTYDHEQTAEHAVALAAVTALLSGERAPVARVLKSIRAARPSSYDYRERHSYSSAFVPTLIACLGAWVKERKVGYSDLLPREVRLGALSKCVASETQLRTFLASLKAPISANAKKDRSTSGNGKPKARPLFDDREVRDIVKAIELIRTLISPIEDSMLQARRPTVECVESFLTIWSRALRSDGHQQAENGLSRRLGLGIASLLLEHAKTITLEHAQKIVDLLFGGGFTIGQKISILAKLAQRQDQHDLVGGLAKRIAEDIGKDESIDRRGEDYADLTAALIPISVEEARAYYRQGLAELDQIGGDDFHMVYALLRYASAQRGGLLRPELAQRLMNLCQVICHYEPHKFGWTLFSRAMARSVGPAAACKLVRWADQGVADFSYGLPQLACFMTQAGMLDPRRAAVLLAICEDHGWHDWKIGAGLADILEQARPADRRPIFAAIFRKLRAEAPEGGWESKWESLLTLAERFPGVVSPVERTQLGQLRDKAKQHADEYNRRNGSSIESPIVAVTENTDADDDRTLRLLADACDPASATAIDDAVRAAESGSSRPYFAKKRLLDILSQQCPYDKRLGHLLALCEVSTVAIDDVIERIAETAAAWKDTTAHLGAHAREIIDRLFAFKGSRLFDLRYGNIGRQIKILADLCGDRGFVMRGLLRTVAHEQVDLTGEDWLDLATALTSEASPPAALEALELMLAGAATRIADEIGEGPFKADLAPPETQSALLADIVWHLLGEADAYVRWPTARAIDVMAEFGLEEDLGAVVDRFDVTAISQLGSADHRLSFQNSQQWLLMGLARASLAHGVALNVLQPRLSKLAQRSDLHVIDKLLLLRCLERLNKEEPCTELGALQRELQGPPCGYVPGDRFPSGPKSQSGFTFEYDFDKTEIDALARLFGISHGQAVDAVATEIVRRWPDAKNMDYFPGHDRYRHARNDRYENYREHIQRHALISAGTKLSQTLPVMTGIDDASDFTPWDEWLARYDLTFKDGSFLSDHKDEMPDVATSSFLGPRVGRQDVLHDQATLLSLIGMSADPRDPLPVYGSWTSAEGINVRIVSGLAQPSGAIKACTAFAKRPDHNLWIPLFDSYGGRQDPYNAPNPFAPFIWDPDAFNIGVDQGDRFATPAAAARPRLGVTLTNNLKLSPDADLRQWRTSDRQLVLWSAVWGEWQPSSDHAGERQHNDGDILWADPVWLDAALTTLNKQLVFRVSFLRRKSSRDYDDGRAIKAVYVLLRAPGKALRVWHAKTASKPIVY